MLTEAEVRFAKPREKAYKLYDERGLFLLVTPAGCRWWRFKYYILGKERGMSLGVYPDVTLKDAREQRDKLRRLVAQKIDPALADKVTQANTLQVVSEEWFQLQQKKLCAGIAEGTANDGRVYLPRLGPRPIADIKAPELLRGSAVALKFAALVFVRPGELRAAEWSEFNLEAAEWRIPAARMKMKERGCATLVTGAHAPEGAEADRTGQPVRLPLAA